MVQTEQPKRVAIYARVSTSDQSCERQLLDLRLFGERMGAVVVAEFKEIASGAKNDRKERAAVMKLAQAHRIDAVLVTELTRWGRSTIDLISTLQQLQSWKVSVIAQTGTTFDLSSPQGKMIAGVLATLAEFERDLTRERTISGLAAAKARGKKLGRPTGFNPSDRDAPRVLQMVADGMSYRYVAHKLQISKTTVAAIIKRSKAS